MLIPGNAVPEFAVPLVAGGQWTLARSQHELTLVSVMRGLFCTYCHDTLIDLDQHVQRFSGIGIDLLATSTDNMEMAAKTVETFNLKNLSVGFGLTTSDIRRLELFATERDGLLFAEPAILIIRRDGTVYAVFQTSVSCGRLDIGRLFEGLKLLAPHGFPLRGNA